jgi:hypothetical protein
VLVPASGCFCQSPNPGLDPALQEDARLKTGRGLLHQHAGDLSNPPSDQIHAPQCSSRSIAAGAEARAQAVNWQLRPPDGCSWLCAVLAMFFRGSSGALFAGRRSPVDGRLKRCQNRPITQLRSAEALISGTPLVLWMPHRTATAGA